MKDTLAALRECLQITFPPVMVGLLEEAVKPQPDFHVIAEILGLDPVLTATVLHLANSPYYGSVQKVTSLERAATILGAKEILKIALSVTYQRHLGETCLKNGVDFYANWRVTIWSAIAAELLAQTLCPALANEAYLTALLKDISLLMMACAKSERFDNTCHGKVITALVDGQLENERTHWETDHCQLSSELLKDWNIPVEQTETILHHHDIDHLSAHPPLTQCVILATRWAELELNSPHNPGMVVHFRAQLPRLLNIDEEQAQNLFARCTQRFQAILATLGIAEAPPSDRFYQHSLQLMQQYHFLASELADAGSGKKAAARIIARHLRFEWGVTRWELALSIPDYQEWDLYVPDSDGLPKLAGLARTASALPWTVQGGSVFPLEVEGGRLGELRLPPKAASKEALKQIALYVRFASRGYEQFSLRLTVLELKAHTLDYLPVGVARLTPGGKVLEANDRLRRFMGLSGSARGLDLWRDLGEGKGFAQDTQWDRFLADSSLKSLHKIFCLWRGAGHHEDICVYLAAEKRTWHGREEILVFLEDVSLVSGWEFKALKQGEFLEKLVRSMRDGVLTIDHTGRITFTSPRLSHLLDKDLFEVAKPLPTYQGPWGPDILAGAPAPVEAHFGLNTEEMRTLEIVFSPLAKQPGVGMQWLVVGRDITTVRRLEAKLKRLAMFDGLTGLLNHYQFHVILERETQRSARTGRPLGLLFFDLDNFKAINDQLGHQAGDDVLRNVARILKGKLRAGMDYPCRYGGDEFAVVVTEVDSEQLRSLAERLLRSASDTFKGRVGLSVGLAISRPNESPSALLKRADQASYLAKSQGGHRQVWAPE
ncbi:HDOD domain-containing protein [Fundidesulfovibrio butyratiphilus]